MEKSVQHNELLKLINVKQAVLPLSYKHSENPYNCYSKNNKRKDFSFQFLNVQKLA